MATAVDDVDLERDRNLVLRAQAGDDTAFASLYSRYYQRLIRFAARRVGNRADAEEIAQEAFARAYRALPDFGAERRFYSWLSVITSRLCIDAMRRGWRIEVGDVADQPMIDAAFDRIERDDDVARLMTAMDQLTPRHREVLELREREGWAYQRIADHYEVSLGTVEALLWRARRALRREYDALGSALLGVPILRRFATARAGQGPQSFAALSAVGTMAALGLTGALGSPAPAAAAALAPTVSIASFHRPAEAATPAPLSLNPAAVVTQVTNLGHTAVHDAQRVSDGVVGRLGPATFYNSAVGRQKIDQAPIHTRVAGIGVGVYPPDVSAVVTNVLKVVHVR